MEIDNFDIFRNHLDFSDKNDRYIVHILRRTKDLSGEKNNLGSNEHQRLIRTYYIDSIEYFNRKKDAIKELCIANNARAYILPQVRNNFECLLNLGEKVLETIRLGNYSVKPEHLLRGAYCECHSSRDKKWIIDLDKDEMIEYTSTMGFPHDQISQKKWTSSEVLEFVRRQLANINKLAEDAYIVKTPNGHHIITPPFDLQKAQKTCSMLFEGEKKKQLIGYKSVGPGEYDPIYKNIIGWLHKDGMSLLYYKKEK